MALCEAKRVASSGPRKHQLWGKDGVHQDGVEMALGHSRKTRTFEIKQVG